MYYKVLVIKTLCYWHTIKLIDQWRRIEYPEKDLLIYFIPVGPMNFSGS